MATCGGLINAGYLWPEGCTLEKELIKPGSENIYLFEVEDVIQQHHMENEVAVIGIPDPQWGDAIKVLSVMKILPGHGHFFKL